MGLTDEGTRVRLAAVVFVAAVGCSTRAQDTADGANACPNNVPLGCSCPTSYDGGVCVCSCFSTSDFSMPECPVSAQYSPSWPACDFAGACMNCLGGAAGIICNCSDAGLQGA